MNSPKTGLTILKHLSHVNKSLVIFLLLKVQNWIRAIFLDCLKSPKPKTTNSEQFSISHRQQWDIFKTTKMFCKFYDIVFTLQVSQKNHKNFFHDLSDRMRYFSMFRLLVGLDKQPFSSYKIPGSRYCQIWLP